LEFLREEILNAQKVRSDLLKWKLGLVGTLGAVGLGLAGADTAGHPDLVLCAVPFVSVYVDLLCRHLSLRILVIGKYQQRSGVEELAGYEEFVEKEARDLTLQGDPDWFVNRMRAAVEALGRLPEIVDRPSLRRHFAEVHTWHGNAFDLEDWAVSWSSLTLSLAVLVYGVFVVTSAAAPGFALIASGAVGIVVTLAARTSYNRRQRAVRAIGPRTPPQSGSIGADR
jgi:hypothetical protein